MKSSLKLILSLLVLSFIFSTHTAEAQFLKKLKKRSEKAAEEAVIRKTENKVYDETSKKMDTILGNDGKTKGKKPTGTSDKNPIGSIGENGNANNGSADDKSSDEVNIYSKFDFVPGDELLFFDDFEKDFIGDFPAKWDTNGSGELITINEEKWFRLSNNSMYIPIINSSLPENYTIEFDMLMTGLDNKTSSQAFLVLLFADNNNFQNSKTWSMVEISPCQFIESQGVIEKQINGERQLRNKMGKDYRNVINGKTRISIAANKSRLRVWINENKIVDVPRLLADGITNFKIYTRGLRDDRNVDEIYIKDFKMAETGMDLRRKLIEEGSVSTNGILFNSGSATIKPQSYGLILQISQVLQQEINMRLNIIGHTDADGPEEANLVLSKQRAESVKNALMTIYDISGDRLQTEGKGESVSIGDNNTPDGKAQNRRVEFVKI